MIWGLNCEQRRKKREAKDNNWFAWRPVRLDNCRWCWLIRVKRELHANWGDCWWEYSLK